MWVLFKDCLEHLTLEKELFFLIFDLLNIVLKKLFVFKSKVQKLA